MTDCPACGYHDPFMRSWFEPEREVAESLYFKEWDPELYTELLNNPWVQVGDFMYHRTKKGAIQRWKIVDIAAKKNQRIQYDTKASQRKNWHLKGKRREYYRSTSRG